MPFWAIQSCRAVVSRIDIQRSALTDCSVAFLDEKAWDASCSFEMAPQQVKLGHNAVGDTAIIDRKTRSVRTKLRKSSEQ